MESMNTLQPKYVALDTSTYLNLLKRQTDPQVKDTLDALNSGQIVPYVTFDHVLELLQGDDQKSRLDQLDFFEKFNLIAYPKHFPSPPWRNSTICASYLDLQEFEISALRDDSNLSLEQVINRVKLDAVAEVRSGRAIAYEPVLRDIARSGRATSIVQLNRAAASMIHSSPQNPQEVIASAGEYTMLGPQGAEQLRSQLITQLAQQLRQFGDRRLEDIDLLAANIVEQALKRVIPNYRPSGADPFRELARNLLGLDLDRLPPGSTADDFVTETLYRSRMALHERRMRLEDRSAYRAITRQQLPSITVWFALEREAKSNMPTAEGGNMLDFPLAALPFYIDKVQVDRRVLHLVEVAANKNPFLKRIRTNLFRSKDLKELLEVLNSL
jgi:hypothetical protein